MKRLIWVALMFISWGSQGLTLTPLLENLEKPTDLVFLPQSSHTLLIAQKNGLLVKGDLASKTVTPIHDFDVRSSSELGLLGIALHPKFADNGFVFFNYNPKSGDTRTRISRFTLSEKDGQFRLMDEKVLLEIAQPYRNHNAGQLAFGPEGYLYIGTGDGGSRNDPKGHGQDKHSLLGNILRIDVDSSANQPYLVPSDNPFVGEEGTRPEIWAYGLRNPWRFTFQGTYLIVADVGQNEFEEVNLVTKGGNYGWKIMEGHVCFKHGEPNCNKTAYQAPMITYGRDQGVSITGGKVYTSGRLPKLINRYLYADFITGKIWSASFPSFTDNRLELDSKLNISTFGKDYKGEVYLTDFGDGVLYRVD